MVIVAYKPSLTMATAPNCILLTDGQTNLGFFWTHAKNRSAPTAGALKSINPFHDRREGGAHDRALLVGVLWYFSAATAEAPRRRGKRPGHSTTIYFHRSLMISTVLSTSICPPSEPMTLLCGPAE